MSTENIVAITTCAVSLIGTLFVALFARPLSKYGKKLINRRDEILGTFYILLRVFFIYILPSGAIYWLCKTQPLNQETLFLVAGLLITIILGQGVWIFFIIIGVYKILGLQQDSIKLKENVDNLSPSSENL